MQQRLAERVLKLRPHKTRRLLKSTLMEAGCAEWAADHVIGHKSDAYTGPAELFPKALRREYSRASHKINILSKAASTLDDAEPVDEIRKELDESKAKNKEMQERLNKMQAENTENAAKSADAESKFNAVINALLKALDNPGEDLRKSLKDSLSNIE